MATNGVGGRLGLRRLGRFAKDSEGNVAILFGLSLVVLLLAIGAAIDIGRWLHARDQTVAAVDAALLAGGRALQTDNEDESGAIAAAQKFYDQNVTSRLPVTDDTVTFTVTDGGTAMTASGEAYIKTPFLRLASIDKLPLISKAATDFSKAELAVGGNGGENLEISMMLDVTGSMSGQKLTDLKDAAKDLIDIVIWDDQSEFTSKVALVPFSADIRLPKESALVKARGPNPDETKTKKTGGGWWGGGNTTTYYLSDCVVERTGQEKYTDAAPAQNRYVTPHYTENYTQSGNGNGNGWGWGGGWGNGGKKEGVCSVPENAAIVPLSDDKAALKSAVNGLSASGNTAGHLGTAWSWYTLSPNWASLWSGQHRPKAYGTENLRKIAVLMTDGEYNTQYDSDGIDASASGAANGSSSTQARALCNAMKAKGITVYTVGFQLSGTYSQSYQTLYQCASDPGKFYDAKDGEQLKQAFRDIALKLSSLYLSK